MWFVEEDIRKILIELPSECSYLDYKETPYLKSKKHDFIKDVVAMLNSPESIRQKKYIIFGVTNDKKLIGIKGNQPDDNEYQNWADNIVPRPQLQTGTITFKDKIFGYVYLLDTNEYVVHEVKNSVSGDENYKSVGKNSVLQGQAFWRRGSRNEIMMQLDREWFLEHKTQETIQILAPSNLPPKGVITNIVTLLGAWAENRTGDCNAVERIYGKNYSIFQQELRDFYSKNQEFVSFSNNVWSANSRKQLLEYIASGLFDDQIDGLHAITCDVISSTDPFLNLVEKNIDQSTKSENCYIYSDELRKNLFKFWAYAGNHVETFSLLSRNKIGLCIRDIVEKIIYSDNWKVLVTNSKMLKYLAESFPIVFLDVIETAIKDKKVGLFFALRNDGRYTYSTDFAYSLSEALGLLATYKDYFSKAGLSLVALCAQNEVFLDRISIIMLPWFPQTEADASIRKGLLKAAFAYYSDIAWKLILTLLPHRRTSSYPISKAKYLDPANISEKGASIKDYREETAGLITLACHQAEGNMERLVDLIPVMGDASENSRIEILNALKKGFLCLSDSHRYYIWLELKDFLSKHKKYADAEWAIDEEQLLPIDELVNEFEKGISLPNERRLFRKDQWELLEMKGNYNEEKEKIFRAQIAAAESVIGLGVESFFDFLDKIQNQKVLGTCMANIETSEKIWPRVLNILEQPNSPYAVFASAFLQEAYKENRDYLASYLTKADPEHAIILYELLPITTDVIRVLKKVSPKLQEHYWKTVDTFGMEVDDKTRELIIENFIEHERENDALSILYSVIEIQKENIPSKIVANALIKCSEIDETNTNSYILEYLIDYVEESNIGDNQKAEIEWKYLNLLARERIFNAKAIYRQFDSDPAEFMRVFSMIHKGESNDEIPPFDAGIYSLLNHWKVVPGTKADGLLDSDYLKTWIADVLAIAEKTNRVDSVRHYLGKILFHSPAAKDGLFIDKAVAELLNSDDTGNMLNGYFVEAIASRGIHIVDETGNIEFKLEEDYREKALVVEKEGFTRFANTLRAIAIDYHDEALHNIEEAQKWRESDNLN